MARVHLEISDSANRLTLRVMLEAEGHVVADAAPEVVITDNAEAAIAWAGKVPALVLAELSDVPDAVRAMRKGVYGYILAPFQPGEAEIMLRRAVESRQKGIHPEALSPQGMETLAEVEARHIRKVLRYCRNNRAKAARLLGIGRNTLWRKLKETEEADGPSGGNTPADNLPK